MKSAQHLVPRAATTAACVFLISLPYPAWAQTVRTGPPSDAGLWIQGLIFGVGALIAYGVMFHAVFPALLWQRSPPLAAYAWSSALWVWVLTALLLLAFWNNLIPIEAPPGALWERHKWHVGLLLVGFLLSLSPFFLLRKPHDT